MILNNSINIIDIFKNNESSHAFKFIINIYDGNAFHLINAKKYDILVYV